MTTSTKFFATRLVIAVAATPACTFAADIGPQPVDVASVAVESPSRSASPTLAEPELATSVRPLDLRISEFFIDPPQPGDEDKYLEISGSPRDQISKARASGEFSYFLLLLENEADEAGQVDKIIPLAGVALNDKGYAWFYGAGGEEYPAEDGYQYEGTLEESGGTLMLVAVPFGERTPADGDDYDGTVEGTAQLGGDWDPAWTVLDSVGVCCRAKDVARGGALYAPVNFAAGEFTTIATPRGARNVNTAVYDPNEDRGPNDHINYVGRMGRRWFAARLVAEGENWSRRQRSYSIGTAPNYPRSPQVVDNYFEAPYDAFDDITTTQGATQPGCGCGGR